MKLCLICKMLVRCSNCEMGYVDESITLLDIGLVTNRNAGGLHQPKQSVGCTNDGKSTGSRRRQRASARPSGATDAKCLTIANAIELTR
jgi:hypothetical protein